MHTFLIVLLLTATSYVAIASPFQKRVSPVPIRAASFNAIAFAKPSPDEVTNNYLTLQRVYNDGKHGIDKCPKGFSPAVQEVRPYAGISYTTDVLLNEERHSLILDTGSSDTWLFKSDYACHDILGFLQPQSFCNAGPGYTGNFPSDNPLRDIKLDIRYGDNTYARGQFGFVNMTIAGLKVVQQQIALANESYWRGDNTSAGLLGLGYPALTAAYLNGNATQRIEYDPLFTSMWKQNVSSPLFSVALRRDGPGYLAFGGLPPVNYTNVWASTPIVVSMIRQVFDYGYYSIRPDGFLFNSSATLSSEIYLVDTGSTLSYFPTAIAKSFNSLFDPPASLIDGGYHVQCNQTPPDFAIQIGGVVLKMNARDVISQVGTRCMSGIQDGSALGIIGGENQPVGLIGDSFLNGVLAVHDVGAAQMRFAEHLY